ncbi:hypothetical protein [Lacticaseibacillus sharpeae]|uniref:hypothetical protein n=1 Tax=Lacticaseibacillus sharpeae TaxID=1626 RepID=UPI0006D03FB3|nr:hypothetical protein [Lacticaseibacillus sharpeae]
MIKITLMSKHDTIETFKLENMFTSRVASGTIDRKSGEMKLQDSDIGAPSSDALLYHLMQKSTGLAVGESSGVAYG